MKFTKMPDFCTVIKKNKPRINFFSKNGLLTTNGYKRIVKYKNKADLRKNKDRPSARFENEILGTHYEYTP